jgi:nardilysin
MHKVCAELLALLIQDVTTETCYLASVCELGNSIYATDKGIDLRVYGFDAKLLFLTEEILQVLFAFNTLAKVLPTGVNPDRFDACLDILHRRYNNNGMTASSLSSIVRLRCIRPTIWSAKAKVSTIKCNHINIIF